MRSETHRSGCTMGVGIVKMPSTFVSFGSRPPDLHARRAAVRVGAEYGEFAGAGPEQARGHLEMP